MKHKLYVRISFNPCFVGFALGGAFFNCKLIITIIVSILVLLDLPWEGFFFHGFIIL